MWVSQVWSPHAKQTCPEGTEQRAALITQGSCCHIVTAKHPVPRCCAVLSPPAVAAMTTQTMALLAQQMQHECPLKYGKLNQSHCLSDSLFASSCLLSPALFSSRVKQYSWNKPVAAWKAEYVTMERHWDHSSIWENENHTMSSWLKGLGSDVWKAISLKIAKLRIHDRKCDNANFLFVKKQLVNSSLPVVCSHWTWSHVYLSEAPQWVRKHTVMVGYTLSTDQLHCMKDHSPMMILNHRFCCHIVQ